jgi:hypothetical protein
MGEIPDGYWACACVKRDDAGRMTHIGMQPPRRRKCKECGAKKPTGLFAKPAPPAVCADPAQET